jgi:hypothetical protein
MKMSPFFIGCCQPCPEKMANDLSFLQLPSHVHDKAMERFHAFHQSFWSTLALELGDDSIRNVPWAFEASRGKGKSSSNRRRKRSGASPAKNMDAAGNDNRHGRRKLLGLVPALYGTGAQLQGMLKCCNICPEQYYSPADYEDTTTFLSEEELRGHRVRGAHSARASVNREAELHQAGQQDRRRSRASTNEDVLNVRVSETSAMSTAAKKGGSKGGSKGGTKDGSCCKICPTDRFPYRGVSAFSIGAKEAFIEVMEKGHATHRTKQMASGIIPALNVGQSGCCPVCPVSLAHSYSFLPLQMLILFFS